jgi:hypothetical protein
VRRRTKETKLVIVYDRLFIGGSWTELSDPALLDLASSHDQSVIGRAVQVRRDRPAGRRRPTSCRGAEVQDHHRLIEEGFDMKKEPATDTAAATGTATATAVAAAAARQARFGKLPERIRFEDLTVEVEAEPGGAASYDPEGSWKYYSCLALDLGL